MMKKFIFASILLGLTACSTTPSHDAGGMDDIGRSNSGGSSYSDAPSYEGEEKSAGSDSAVQEVQQPRTPPSSSHYSALDQAVRADNDEAIYKAATQILVQAPNDPRALNALAMYHYKKGRFDLSRYLLTKALSGQGKSSEIYSNLGVVQLAQNERRDAVKSFRRALELNNSDAVASANLGSIYTAEKDYAKAVMILETSYRRGTKDARILNNYAVALTATGKYDQADKVYQEALKASGNSKEVLFNYAVLLVEHTQKYQQGLEVINRLKFVGGPAETRNRIIALENKAKAGLK